MRRNGIGPRHDLTYLAPMPGAGKSFCSCAPARWAANISVGVCVPGIMATPRSSPAAMTASSTTGDTRNDAPASIAACACSTVSTVPAPTARPSRCANSAMRSIAPGVVSVNSTTRKPARTAASMAGAAADSIVVRRIALARTEPSRREELVGRHWHAGTIAGKPRSRLSASWTRAQLGERIRQRGRSLGPRRTMAHADS